MTTEKKLENPAAWIEGIIKDFIDNSPENTLKKWDNEKAFGTPLVGFSRGDDPLYEDYKDHVGPFLYDTVGGICSYISRFHRET